LDIVLARAIGLQLQMSSFDPLFLKMRIVEDFFQDMGTFLNQRQMLKMVVRT
jgi:hypothetical protein